MNSPELNTEKVFENLDRNVAINFSTVMLTSGKAAFAKLAGISKRCPQNNVNSQGTSTGFAGYVRPLPIHLSLSNGSGLSARLIGSGSGMTSLAGVKRMVGFNAVMGCGT